MLLSCFKFFNTRFFNSALPIAIALTLLMGLFALHPLVVQPAVADDPEPPTEIALAVTNSPFATNEQATLTATLDSAVSGTETIYIWDNTINSLVHSCSSGSTCTTATSFLTGGAHSYVAFVGTSSYASNARLTSNIVSAERLGWIVGLTTNKAQFETNSPATLTATTNQPLNGDSYGYRLDIVDTSTGAALASCTGGTTCTATVDYKTGPARSYVAKVMQYNAYSGSEATSDLVQVERTPWLIGLTTDKTHFPTNSPATLTATVNQPLNADEYGYRLDIVDTSTGYAIKTCNTGVTCTTTVDYKTGPARDFVAKVIQYNSYSGFEASSTPTTVARTPWEVTLTANTEDFDTQTPATLTATTNQPLNADEYGYRLDIVDLSTGNAVKTCNAGTECTTSIDFKTGPARSYAARIIQYNAYSGYEYQSNTVLLARRAWNVTLTTNKTQFPTNSPATLTATTNQPLNANEYGYRLDIVDTSTGYAIASCNADIVCTATVDYKTGPARTYVAKVVQYNAYSGSEQTSNSIEVARLPWVASLTTDKLWFATNQTSTITAHTNQPLNANEYGYRLDIVDLTTANVIHTCNTGIECSVSTKFYTGQPHQYVARVVQYNSYSGYEKQTKPVKLARVKWGLTMEESNGVLIATANQPASIAENSSAYGISIWDTSTNNRVAFCTSGNTCSYATPSSTSTYQARIDTNYGADIQANSDGYVADTGRPSESGIDLVGGGNPAAHACQCPEGDPVNTATGEFYENYTDILIPGRTPLHWSRSYSSAKAGTLGPFGYGWSGLSTMELRTPYSDGSVQIVQENGSVTEFDYDAVEDEYKVPDSTIATLVEQNNGNWVYTRRQLEIFTFNSAGELVSQTSPTGNTVTYTRNTAGKVTGISSDAGQLTISYDGDLVSQVTTGDNRSVSYTYNNQQQLTAFTDLRGKTWEYFYNASGLIDQVKNPRGHSVYNEYDIHDRVIEQTDAENGVITFAYSGPPTDTTMVTRFTDAENKVTDYTYDNGWLVSKTVNPLGTNPRTWTYIQGTVGLPIAVKGPNQVWVYATYDADGNVASSTDAVGKTTHYQYNEFGQVKSLLNPEGTQVTSEYDNIGRITSTTTPLDDNRNATTYFYYDDTQHPGDLTRVKDAEGNFTYYTYNTKGLLTQTESPDGRIESFTYNAAGFLTSQTTPRGHDTNVNPAPFTTTYTYDDSGLMLSKTDGDSNQIEFDYDAAGNLREIEDATDAVTTTQYDKNNRAISVTDDSENTFTYTRDAMGAVVKEKDAAGTTVKRMFNAYGDLSKTISPHGAFFGATTAQEQAATTTYSYNTFGELTGTSTPNPGGGDPIETSFTYDAAGRVLTTTDAEDNTTVYTYTDLGLVDTVQTPGGGITDYEYNKAGWLVSVEDPAGRVTEFVYDKLGRTTRVENNAGEIVKKVYTADGLLEKVVDPRGMVTGATQADYTTQYGYDLDGNLVSVTDPLQNVSTSTYDNLGQLTQTVDSENKTTAYEYDERGLLTKITNPDGGEVTYNYNSLGQVTSQTDAATQSTSFTYDAAGRPVSKTDPLLREWAWEYDATGSMVEETTPEGVIGYEYDALGRLVEVDYSDNTPDVAYGYNRNSQRSSMTDGAGTISYTYTADGAVASTTRGQDEFVYTWDQAGQLLSSDGPNGVVDYIYDTAGRVETMTTDPTNPNGGKVHAYEYTPAGQLKAVVAPNGVVSSRTYNKAGQLTDILTQYTDGDEELRAWDIDSLGSPTALTVTKTPNVGTPTVDEYSWLYDDAGRLAHECLAATCSDTTADQSWFYDDRGSLTQHDTSTESVVYTHDVAGQLVSSATTTSSGTTNAAFTYDDAGNMLTGSGRTNTWNLAGQLTSTTKAGTEVSYTYDGDGNRTAETIDDGVSLDTTEFVWDVASASMPILAVDASPVATNKHTWHPDGSAASTSSDTGSAIMDTYFELDRQNSVVGSSDITGVQTESFEYDPFGQRRGPPPALSRLGHNSQQQDQTTGLTYLRARYYDPALGVFLSPDPIGGSGDSMGGQSLFAYGNNNPLLYVDPLGLCGFMAVNKCLGFGDALSAAGSAVGDFASERWTEAKLGMDYILDNAPPEEILAVYAGELNGLFLGLLTEPFKAMGVEVCYEGYKWGSIYGTVASFALGAPGLARGGWLAFKWTKARYFAGSPAAPKTATQVADEALAAGRTSGAASVLATQSGKNYYGLSGTHNPKALPLSLRQELASVPTKQKAPWHGKCAEISCIGQALKAGDNPQGGKIVTVAIGNSRPAHGVTKKPCTSCAHVLERYNIEAY